MKNILVIQGGGRPKGNTEQLIDSFVKGAAESGHKADIRLVNTCRFCKFFLCHVSAYSGSCNGMNQDVFRFRF